MDSGDSFVMCGCVKWLMVCGALKVNVMGGKIV